MNLNSIIYDIKNVIGVLIIILTNLSYLYKIKIYIFTKNIKP